MNVTKLQAFSVHFALSFLVFFMLVAVMYYIWFPGDYFNLDGGWQGLQLIAAIDLVLGPVLTLLFFKPGKPKLMVDMSIIAALQIGALSYGIHAAFQQQTVGLVFSESEFSTLSYRDLQLANSAIIDLGLKPTNFQKLDEDSPRQIFTEAPSGENYGRYLADVLNGLPALRERTDKYKSLSKNHEQLARFKLDHDYLKKNNALSEIKALLDTEKKSLDDFEYYKFKARYGSGIALFDIERKRVVHLIQLTSVNNRQVIEES